MPTNKRDPRITKSVESFARGLLTTTCLTVACTATAGASIIVEGTPPAPANFPNFPNGYMLPLGTTEVDGSAQPSGSGNDVDYFEFQGLEPNTAFSIVALASEAVEAGIEVFSTTPTLTSLTFSGVGGEDGGIGNVSGLVPSNGLLVVEFTNFDGERGPDSYSVSLTATEAPASAPEPGTLGSMGLAVAGGAALAWRRKRNQLTNAAGDSLASK